VFLLNSRYPLFLVVINNPSSPEVTKLICRVP